MGRLHISPNVGLVAPSLVFTVPWLHFEFGYFDCLDLSLLPGISSLLLFLLKWLAQVEEPVDLQGRGSTLLGKMGSGISGRTHQAFPGWH